MSDTIASAAKKIRLAVFDMDGVLTDGRLYLLDDGQNLKAFHCHDGLGIKLLAKTGIITAVITAHRSALIDKRMAQLQVDHVYQGVENKITAYEELISTLNVRDDEVAYMGDDLPDIAIIRRVGLGIAVANAADMVKQFALYTTHRNGGEGAVREVCELIMQAQNTFKNVHEAFL
jgi:3-deoxy-D-manno-octulosonate 8-phosphate phosphatase (KDO 8-P phosphatase)